MEKEKLVTLQEMIDQAARIVFFGGAGVSTESGIPDFRSAQGIYNTNFPYTAEEVVSHHFFFQNPDKFYEFYKEKMIFPDAKPNACHIRLAELEQAGKLTAIITQNIDGLHQKAGSSNVLELHGTVHRNFCLKCHKQYDVNKILESGTPHCSCGGLIKPDVVLYGEQLDQDVLKESIIALQTADLLIIGGTSLLVYPAAGLISYFPPSRPIVLINKGTTGKEGLATLVINEPIGEVFKEIKISPREG
ncbi:MAG: NAD-dependent protein deacylase [Bacilli bacterium]